MDQLRKILAEKEAQEMLKGQWYSIQWIPDLSTGEVLNLGVGIKLEDGTVQTKCLDYFDRIECLFSSRDMIFHARLACDVATEVISNKGFTESIAPQIKCVARGFTQGKSCNEILKRLYSSVVTLGQKRRVKAKAHHFNSINRDVLYSGIKSRLEEKLELEFGLYVPHDPYVSFKNNTKAYLPFKNKNGSGTLVSAAYKDLQRVKCNLFDGYRDIEVASEYLNETDNAVFLMLPGSDLELSKLELIENEIDKFTWLMKKHSIHVECEHSEETLADKVSEWCLKAA
ncbi:hypothetical protein [Pseudoalteromonas sp. BSi20495]|uniref:hypothetical protein n=1 Tax=Pseudoalteromonas sp. BSi20495 TaxID=386429 RepID=UPI0002316427|nr:hypothetical protein [Pseudoalteromonas sp. BSi20495]GAA78514.1 hypothetical protein P20495_1005 [Pseudoalteromonas sp. BSi20495]